MKSNKKCSEEDLIKDKSKVNDETLKPKKKLTKEEKDGILSESSIMSGFEELAEGL